MKNIILFSGRKYEVTKRYIKLCVDKNGISRGVLQSDTEEKWIRCPVIKKESFQKDLENKLKKK